MFSDPFTAVMALILLAFIGTLAVFLRIWRELDHVRTILRDIRESLQFYAVDIAQQNRDLARIVRELRGMSAGRDERDPANECLSELLERGLPNIASGGGNARHERPRESDSAKSDDAELFRRLGYDEAREKSSL